MNRIVYSQLAVATVDGTAYHLVKKFEDSRDGHEAWNALLTWYDGDSVKNETAETIRARLEGLKLHQGSSAENYINKFQTSLQELDRIDGERYSASHKIYLFLRNIEDNEYGTIVTILRSGGSTLENAITTLRKAERDLIAKRGNKRRGGYVRRTGKKRRDSSDDESDDEPPRKRRGKVRRLKGDIETTLKGYLTFPPDIWKGDLHEEDRAFVQAWNGKVRHGESTDGIKAPAGVKIIVKVRRTVTPTKSAESDDDSSTKKKPKTTDASRKKKIRFNLDHGHEANQNEDMEDV